MPALDVTLEASRRALLAARTPEGHWEGRLSTSALSTATAVLALHSVDPNVHGHSIADGCNWLVEHQNEDGGWGDTVKSFSNLATSLLCWAALNRCGEGETRDAAIRDVRRWLEGHLGAPPDDAVIQRGLEGRYGRDRTFAVPILMAGVIGGVIGAGESERHAWSKVLPLPFELSIFPRSWYAALRFPVVSYALPALIAIGYARFHQAPPRLWPLRALRERAWRKASRLLEKIQPSSGGFLEAAPLTSFVTMALANSGEGQHPVAREGVRFLVDSVRPDGSWPIDTNLATWTTTLSIKALAPPEAVPAGLDSEARQYLREWLLGQQYRERHPYTDAAPGGWAWTDLPGGVPDADDTPGALLALEALGPGADREAWLAAAEQALVWLADLQNRDGGIPTFCRGWGTLPFDRSSPDLTAHTLRAIEVWRPRFADHPTLARRLEKLRDRAHKYLQRCQDPSGCWRPLWFGNQYRPDEDNPTYGTTGVLRALEEHDPHNLRHRALQWLLNAQREDGGWGGGDPSHTASIEETALAIDALASPEWDALPEARRAREAGLDWLDKHTAGGTRFPPSPIGFYFAKLWYFETLYPRIWTVGALTRCQALRNRKSAAGDAEAGEGKRTASTAKEKSDTPGPGVLAAQARVASSE